MIHALGLRRFSFLILAILLAPTTLVGGELYIGATTRSITPDLPVALQGQRHTRISQGVDSPVIVAALAIETRDGDKSLDQAVLVACDLAMVPDEARDRVREALKEQIPDFDPQKLILSATHAHTAPAWNDEVYEIPKSGVVQPADYLKLLVERIMEATVEAWKSRQRGSVGWGLGHAVVGQHRIAVSDSGKAQMYGNTALPTFQRFEGYEDHGVEVLCFWNESGQLLATAVNVACPAQEVENGYKVDADFWHPVRETLKQKHGENLVVLGWSGSAGDQSPHPMIRKAAEERMRTLRRLTRLEEIARRVVAGWEEAYAGAEQERHADVPLAHRTLKLDLPKRQVTQEEALAAETAAARFKDVPKETWNFKWNNSVVERFRSQKPTDVYPSEAHVLRLGDCAIATNQFELYLDYGIQMKARSPALQTFVIQLAGGGTYLPTARAVPGGAYGSVPQSTQVGPEGGRMLVEETLRTLGELWPKESAAKK
jgi:hypothetical protein